MTENLSQHDWEYISAYLDDQLQPGERARLEERMQADGQFRLAVDQMKQTRAMIRSVPRVRAPRNFTLTPEMAGVRTFPMRIAPTFQWASAFAALLFVLVLTFDLLGGPLRGAELSVMQAEPAALEAIEQAVEEDLAKTLTVTEEMELQAAPAAPQEAPLESEGFAGDQESPESALGRAPTTQPTPTAELAPSPTPEPQPRVTPVPDEGQGFLGRLLDAYQGLLRPLEIFLVSFAIASGLLAFFLRRAR